MKGLPWMPVQKVRSTSWNSANRLGRMSCVKWSTKPADDEGEGLVRAFPEDGRDTDDLSDFI